MNVYTYFVFCLPALRLRHSLEVISKNVVHIISNIIHLPGSFIRVTIFHTPKQFSSWGERVFYKVNHRLVSPSTGFPQMLDCIHARALNSPVKRFDVVQTSVIILADMATLGLACRNSTSVSNIISWPYILLFSVNCVPLTPAFWTYVKATHTMAKASTSATIIGTISSVEKDQS